MMFSVNNDRVITTKFLKLRGDHEALRNEVKVSEALQLLHAVDVLVQAILAGYLVRSDAMRL